MTDLHLSERVIPSFAHAPNAETTTDDEILAAVLNALHHNSGVPSEHIRAQVKDGNVVLTGVVNQDYERAMAEQAAAATPGVRRVENNLTQD